MASHRLAPALLLGLDWEPFCSIALVENDLLTDRAPSDARPSAGFAHSELVSAAKLGAPLLHRVRFQDVDAAGIVFYPRLFEYFHDAFVVFLRAGGHSLERALAARAWAAPIGWAEAHFLLPLRFGDEIETAVVRVDLEGAVLRLGFRTTLAGKPAAVGTTQAVFVDLATFQRAEPPLDLAAFFTQAAGEAAAR